jgi:hypothetical protein
VSEAVSGWKGVLVIVGVAVSVGVSEAVPVRMLGVRLPVGVKRNRVPVAVAVMGVLMRVGVGAFGSGANPAAIQPMQ